MENHLKKYVLLGPFTYCLAVDARTIRKTVSICLSLNY